MKHFSSLLLKCCRRSRSRRRNMRLIIRKICAGVDEIANNNIVSWCQFKVKPVRRIWGIVSGTGIYTSIMVKGEGKWRWTYTYKKYWCKRYGDLEIAKKEIYKEPSEREIYPKAYTFSSWRKDISACIKISMYKDQEIEICRWGTETIFIKCLCNRYREKRTRILPYDVHTHR